MFRSTHGVEGQERPKSARFYCPRTTGSGNIVPAGLWPSVASEPLSCIPPHLFTCPHCAGRCHKTR
eukprot:2869270-Prymnesium_polylepis.1